MISFDWLQNTVDKYNSGIALSLTPPKSYVTTIDQPSTNRVMPETSGSIDISQGFLLSGNLLVLIDASFQLWQCIVDYLPEVFED